MEGPVELRMPETLRSSLGLQFIDHASADMPPLAMLDPFPQWSVDEKTGECSYRCAEAKGVEFSTRVRPYEEEIFLEFRARNTSGKAIGNLWHQECLDVKDSPEFGMTEDIEHADDRRRSHPIADRDVIARVSEDGGRLLAMWWENAPIPIADSDIPCLHSGPGPWPTLAPGDEAVWRGKIYLMKNDPDALLRRRRGDGGEWLYPEITERLEQQRQEAQKQ